MPTSFSSGLPNRACMNDILTNNEGYILVQVLIYVNYQIVYNPTHDP